MKIPSAPRLLALTLFSLSAYATAPHAQETTLHLINEYPATSITAGTDLQFAATVEKLSNGGIKIATLQESANPYKGKEQVAAVSTDKAEMGTLFAGILGGSDPFFLLSSLPFVVGSFEQAQALFACAQPELENHVSKLNARLLYVTPWPPSGIWSAQPVSDIASVKALRIRTYDDNSRGVFERLGAQSANLPFSAVGPKLVSGELNAVLSSGDGGAGNKLWEYLPNFTAVNYAIPLSYTIINTDAWNRLSQNQQTLLTQAAAITNERTWNTVKDRIEANYARMRDNNMTLNLAPSDGVRNALRQAGDAQTISWWKQNNATAISAQCLNKTGS
jgi:TRAP-type C4-dicarboxylate transport system substrate-binding protein